jgi:UDP-N-acetylglucosamine diphosphorylase / glucose-1-phosphate thymidylyltransferase / UDP-N-acetylgalactosamine diphosphorylase / glucosamine-1-phosphate N-acetyltransferase / galactosamine-1-phosphate N-acetyltransferase
MTLIVFEDEIWRNFATIAQARPLFELRCGGYTLRERAAAVAGIGPALGLARRHLMGHFGPPGGLSAMYSGQPTVLINARCLDLAWLPQLLAEPLNTAYLADGDLIGARLSPALASAVLYYLRDQQATDARDELIRFARVVELSGAAAPARIVYPWDLIAQSGEQIVRDLPLLSARLPSYGGDDPHVVIHGTQVFVGPDARLDGPLVLDARDGPIFIENGAHIEPFSFIQGPTYIGAGSLIASARIRGETSIGPICRIGGEVEASIVQGYSNKHHDGFLGHSWLGEWVNIGAMTTNSDLKNNYGSVRVSLEGVGQVDSGVIKLGCFLADHVKLGIGLHLNGGTMIGTASNIFGVHSAPKTVPPFTWGGEIFREYRIDNMIGVARTVMGRRKCELSPSYEALLRAVFDLTKSSRGDMGDLPVLARVVSA